MTDGTLQTKKKQIRNLGGPSPEEECEMPIPIAVAFPQILIELGVITAAKVVALTIDDAPHDEVTPEVGTAFQPSLLEKSVIRGAFTIIRIYLLHIVPVSEPPSRTVAVGQEARQ